MIEMNQVYKCSVCGNVVTVLHVGGGKLACCGRDMVLMEENTVDASVEKHVPVVEKTAAGITVRVGSEPHPMVDVHYVEWIEAIADGRRYIRYLNPGDSPEAEFPVPFESVISIREYCNIHGLWRA
ncbi:desulfoferrodoxin [Candidatus Uhrbacteria bacterium]|nr:desulfoferrodoxin [Candidatus Uhrbacteria bacterium]